VLIHGRIQDTRKTVLVMRELDISYFAYTRLHTKVAFLHELQQFQTAGTCRMGDRSIHRGCTVIKSNGLCNSTGQLLLIHTEWMCIVLECFILRSPAHRPSYNPVWKYQSSFHTAADIHPLSVPFCLPFSRPIPYFILSFLNVTILDYKTLTKAVCNQKAIVS
jgi:hypothetical protein